VLEDATVPRSQIPAMIKALGGSRQVQAAIGTFGHAGDGNLHPTILTDKRDKEEWHRVELSHRRDLRRGPVPGRHPVRRARHRPGQVQMAGEGNFQGATIYSRRLKRP
jgi:glycolate oxidase